MATNDAQILGERHHGRGGSASAPGSRGDTYQITYRHIPYSAMTTIAPGPMAQRTQQTSPRSSSSVFGVVSALAARSATTAATNDHQAVHR